MNRVLLLATAATVALTGAAFAQTNGTNSTAPKPAATATAPVPSPPASPKAASTPTTTPAPATMAQPAQSTTVKPVAEAMMGKNTAMRPVKSARRERRGRHGAMRPTMAAERLVDRETSALNVLEAKGYGGRYTDFQPDGSNYSAMVTHNGKQQKMIIDPDAGTVTP
jgi:pyruvate/2-oxoglutarate dehydrogenase complex dihydrolipoamide acyltransferase (E2) component